MTLLDWGGRFVLRSRFDALLMSLGAADVGRLPGFLNSAAARPVRFGAVGLVTFGVQLGSFFLFKQAGIPSVIAYALGLALSVQFNFVVNNLLVWGDRPVRAILSRQFVERWATFHGCIAASLVVNMGAFTVAQFFLPDLVAAVVGVGSSTVIKFLSLDRLAFKPVNEPSRAPRSES